MRGVLSDIFDEEASASRWLPPTGLGKSQSSARLGDCELQSPGHVADDLVVHLGLALLDKNDPYDAPANRDDVRHI